MRLQDYPPQEPLSPAGEAYSTRVLELGSGLQGAEFNFGLDPYQSLAVYPAGAPNGDVLLDG